MEHMVEIVVPLGFFALVILLVWLGLRSRKARLEAKSDFGQRLLDKFGSGQEFTSFLDSEGSQRFLKEFWLDTVEPKQKVLRAITIGIVLTILGIGLACLMVWEEDFVYPAIIVASLGVGFLVAGAVTLHLSRRWGLFSQE
jgi:hypothetical protein